jgi:hypothetical protein
MTMINRFMAFVGLLLGLHAVAQAQDQAGLAKQLANPVASLISVPLPKISITTSVRLMTAFVVP